MKKILSLTLALTLCTSLAVPALAVEFSDVPADHWAYSAIRSAAGKGITSGYSDGTFKPSSPVSNIQFMVMLTRAFYAEDVAKWTASSAAPKNEWWWPNWYALTSKDLLVGSDMFNGRTALHEQGNVGITRYDMAWLMATVLKDKGGSATEEQRAEAQVQITDYTSIPAEYQEAVKTAFALGLITGYADGTFGGENSMNRAQGCVVIDRLAQYVGADPGIVSEIPVGKDLTEVPNSPTNQPAEQVPSTTADSGTLTLRDGSAVTEENVLKIINEVFQVYPVGTIWDDDTYRTNITVGGRTLGGVSSALRTIANNYIAYKNGQTGNSSVTGGCGGFASIVSDAIFGGANTGGNNFPARKLDSVSQVRPGDTILTINANGQQTHFFTAMSTVNSSKVVKGVTAYSITRCDGNMNGKVSITESSYIFDDLYNGTRFEAWTRYPA